MNRKRARQLDINLTSFIFFTARSLERHPAGILVLFVYFIRFHENSEETKSFREEISLSRLYMYMIRYVRIQDDDSKLPRDLFQN